MENGQKVYNEFTEEQVNILGVHGGLIDGVWTIEEKTEEQEADSVLENSKTPKGKTTQLPKVKKEEKEPKAKDVPSDSQEIKDKE